MRLRAFVEELRRDVSYAGRMLARNPAFSIVAALTLALGVGANSAVFTVVDAVVFRQLPYEEPDRLVKLWREDSREPTDNLSWPDLEDLRGLRELFAEVAADDGEGVSVTHRDGSREGVSAAIVTSNWLTTLGVRPFLGRAFLSEEEQPGRDRVVMLSHAYWRRRFKSEPGVIGSMLTLDNAPYTIIGVLPPNVLRYSSDVLKPLVPEAYPRERGVRSLDVFARLQPGASIMQAQAALETINGRLEREHATLYRNRGLAIAPLGKYYSSLGNYAEEGLLLMLGAVALVLLIACANVTNLLLARAVARSRECVIRAALGASRGRLVRQMLVESVLLFLIGGTLGVIIARWTVDALFTFAVAAGYVPERMAIALDGRVLAFSLIVSGIAGVLAGVVPALQASGVDVNAGLRASAQTITGGVHRTRATGSLIVAEIALALVLLVGSGLIVRSFLRLQAMSSGVNPEHLLLTRSDGGRNFPVAVAWWRDVLERTRAFPGVQSAAVTSRPPIHGARRQVFFVDTAPGVIGDGGVGNAVGGGGAGADGEQPRAGDILVSADYFQTMGVGLVKGRTFTDRDDGTAPPVAIVSQSFARRYFAHVDPLGRRVMLRERAPMTCCSAAGPVEGVWREIVGVVADVRQASLDEAPAMTIYRPYTQIVEHDMVLMVRASSAAGAARIAAGLRTHLGAIDPAKEWSEVRLMQDVIDGSQSIRVRRFVLILLGSFAAIALLLAAVGTYGVMTYAVAQRTREIGIRVALGATRPAVLREVIGQTMRLTAAGLVLGVIAASFATRFIASLLFGITSGDALTWLAAAGVLVIVALIAAILPARRAVRIDPLVALRQE
jgi:putative ABC transport system permease protein